MIGIIGYGRFGRLTAAYLSRDFPVAVYSRSKTAGETDLPGVVFAPLDEVCRRKIVVVSVPISAMEGVLREMAPLVGPDTLVVDVASVKRHPVRWMETLLPRRTPILATHPMFGPDSAADSLRDRKIVVCPVRLHPSLYGRITAYLEAKGLCVIEATPEAHDRQIAVSLALTHFIGRSLADFGADDLPIDTEGYNRLLHILGVVEHDTWQLFQDMHAYNPYAAAARSAFMASMARIDQQLGAHADPPGP